MSSATSAPSTAPIPGAAISVENLIYPYSKQAQPVLKIANWQVAAGDKVFLSGQSGSGKSTLLNLLSGMIVPESGHLHILGAPLHALSGRKRDGFRAKHLGVVFQQFNLIEYLSVEQNLQAALWFSQNQQSLNPQPLNQGTLHSLFDTLQLPLTTLKQKANQLSVGQQQRVAIARALIHDPELVIVDEPTSALDTDARDSFMQLLLASCQHKTVLFVSHDKSLASYFDQHISMQSLNRLQPTTGSQSC